MPDKQRVGDRAEDWSFGHVIDIVMTRDTWMHGINIARATGRVPQLSPDHDGVLIADIVAEWARRHRQPCRLHLTGSAGGTWRFGSDVPTLELDAVEFCRILSSRAPAALVNALEAATPTTAAARNLSMCWVISPSVRNGLTY